ncbi:hypothetical protein BXY51_004385 [Actinoplanes cyaneus]|nr:hypothetical protein [Actinoplanes cyaneus]
MACGHASRRRYDLEDPAQLRHAYEQVLCEAAGCGEVEDLINPAMLRRVWRDLHLPSRVRDAWETRHPGLRRTVNRTSDTETSRDPSSRLSAGRGFARRRRTAPVTRTTSVRASAA